MADSQNEGVEKKSPLFLVIRCCRRAIRRVLGQSLKKAKELGELHESRPAQKLFGEAGDLDYHGAS